VQPSNHRVRAKTESRWCVQGGVDERSGDHPPGSRCRNHHNRCLVRSDSSSRHM